MKSYTGSSQCIGFLYVLFIWFSQRNKYNFFYLCVVTLFIMWLNCKNKTKKQLKKKKNQKAHEKKDRQKYLTENLPVMKAKFLSCTLTLVHPCQSEVAEIHILEWLHGTEEQRKVISDYAGITKQHGASGAKQLVLRIQHLHYRCFTCLALESV